jgi:hypothetical protein
MSAPELNPTPDRPACEHCPFAGTGTTCPRWPSDHRRYCEWVDPSSSGYKRDGARTLRAIAGRREPGATATADGFPSLATQAANLAGAVVSAVKSRGKRVDPAEKDRRLAICAACPELVDGRCRQCGCVASWKARLAAWSCPINKW